MCSNDLRNGSFSIATFNVHMWVDGCHVDNYERVKLLIRVSNIYLPAKKNNVFVITKCNKSKSDSFKY